MPTKKDINCEKVWSQQYAITITLNPSLFHLATQFQRNAIQGVLNGIVQNGDAQLSLICEMTQSYNIHLHGFVKIPITKSKKSVIHQIHNIFRDLKDIGYICVKPIDKYIGWLSYCLKEYERTLLELEGHNPVIINDMGDFTDIPSLLDLREAYLEGN